MNDSLLVVAQADPALLVQVGSSVLIGLAVYALVRTVVNMMSSADVEQDDSWQYDVTRINELRRTSWFYRVFFPLVILLARIDSRLFARSMPVIARQLQTAGQPRSWTAPEYLASCQLAGLLLLPVYLFFAMRSFGQTGVVIALVGSLMTIVLLRRRLAHLAQHRLFKIKQRMPFLLDLLTLLMEAGSTFLLALEEAVKEFHDHPVGVEFGRVLAEMSMGKSRTAAFESMKERLNDHEITSIVGSIIQGETLGTPLARLFRTQADVLRVKRTQRAETIAGEAGVKMLAPAVLVMAATVIIILGPFLLGFIYTDYIQR